MLQTLAERLPRGEARHILAELPAELKPWVYTEADAEGFGIDESRANELLDSVEQDLGGQAQT